MSLSNASGEVRRDHRQLILTAKPGGTRHSTWREGEFVGEHDDGPVKEHNEVDSDGNTTGPRTCSTCMNQDDPNTEDSGEYLEKDPSVDH